MSEAPKRIWAGKYHGTWWQSKPHHQMTEYIRADLVEAAIKRALEGAAQSVDCACAGREIVLQCGHRNNRLRWDSCGESNCLALEAADIRALDPAQFIEEPKP
jgi:hypothetical protein